MEIQPRCASCRSYFTPTAKKNGELHKTCEKCCSRNKAEYKKNKCVHKRQKSKCVDCGGVGICIHTRQKSQCKVCTDAIQVTITNMIKSSKQKDKKHNRFNELEFVTKDHIHGLIIQSNDQCFYCSVEMQYENYNVTLATIERIDNDLGHNQGNCVIACLHCNSSKVGDKLDLGTDLKIKISEDDTMISQTKTTKTPRRQTAGVSKKPRVTKAAVEDEDAELNVFEKLCSGVLKPEVFKIDCCENKTVCESFAELDSQRPDFYTSFSELKEEIAAETPLEDEEVVDVVIDLPVENPKETVTCICGSVIGPKSATKHLKTKKHLAFIASSDSA
jgi:hypothetical protein